MLPLLVLIPSSSSRCPPPVCLVGAVVGGKIYDTKEKTEEKASLEKDHNFMTKWRPSEVTYHP